MSVDLEALRDRLDILEIAGAATKLELAGEEQKGLCPLHQEKTPSFYVNPRKGLYHCHGCGAGGDAVDLQQRLAGQSFREAVEELAARYGIAPLPPGFQSGSVAGLIRPRPVVVKPEPEPMPDDALGLAERVQRALPGSAGETYLASRRISLELAQKYGIGYAEPGAWPGREMGSGLVVVPHTNLAGELVSLYARSTASSAPKERRHDHLKGVKGYFNAQALTGSQDGPVWVVEGAFDALALLEAGVERVVAVFGVDGWRWSWFRQVADLVFAFDADQAGTDAWRKLAKGAVMRGKRVETLTISAYGGEKDVAAAWAAGVLEVGSSPAMSSGGHSNEEAHREAYDERAAIMEYEAGLSREEAEEAARSQ